MTWTHHLISLCPWTDSVFNVSFKTTNLELMKPPLQQITCQALPLKDKVTFWSQSITNMTHDGMNLFQLFTFMNKNSNFILSHWDRNRKHKLCYSVLSYNVFITSHNTHYSRFLFESNLHWLSSCSFCGAASTASTERKTQNIYLWYHWLIYYNIQTRKYRASCAIKRITDMKSIQVSVKPTNPNEVSCVWRSTQSCCVHINKKTFKYGPVIFTIKGLGGGLLQLW